MRTLTYDEQVQARASRAGPLQEENAELRNNNAELRRQLAQLKDAARLRQPLVDVLDAAPDVSIDAWRPTPPARYTVTDWSWRPEDGRTPERFEEAPDAADRWAHGISAGTGAPTA
ncbi:MAG TPA: hypothetical protein VNM48_03770 [Chloroflexota bacterium]|nr:hypothetical protein [Chloroflexota bacterium]